MFLIAITRILSRLINLCLLDSLFLSPRNNFTHIIHTTISNFLCMWERLTYIKTWTHISRKRTFHLAWNWSIYGPSLCPGRKVFFNEFAQSMYRYHYNNQFLYANPILARERVDIFYLYSVFVMRVKKI